MADDDWKPNGRPKSTIALNFSQDLDNTFGMSNTDGGLDGLAKAVEEKKQALDSQSAELEALNARLKETEERLQKETNGDTGKRTGGATPRKTFIPPTHRPEQSPLASSTMNYWRGGGAGMQGQTDEGRGRGGGEIAGAQTPTTEKMTHMPGGFNE